MSRIRTVKPGLFKHEELSELPEATHLLSISLLNYADDEGYFNANPKLIKAECSPLREPSVPIADSLIQLGSIGYLRLGIGMDGKRYGQIVNFLKHQKVSHPKESEIKNLAIAWEDSGNLHGIFSEASPLNRTELNRTEGKGIEATAIAVAAPSDAQQAVGLWNEMADRTGLPAVQRLTPPRESALRQRLAECGGMDGWSAAVEKVENSSFLNGSGARSPEHQNWRCTFDFVVKASNFTKLLEGNFDDKSGETYTNGFAAIVAETQLGPRADDRGQGELHGDG